MRDRQGTRKPSIREIAIALLSFVVLLGAPALCLSGVLEHPCNCSDNVGGNCSHESDCPGDPCRAVAKALEEVQLIYVDLDKYPKLAEGYGVKLIPDVFFIDREGSVVDRLRRFEKPGPFIIRPKKLTENAE